MKNMKNILSRSLVVAFLLLLCGNMFAQGRINVSGTVKDSKGEPVIGAVVMLTGNTAIGVTTNIDGKYTISIPASAKTPSLTVSCISYQTQVIPVNSRSVIDVVLLEDAQELEEVVVVGYGSMRKSDLTGSVASVRINEDDAAQSTSLDQLIQGRAAGVQVINTSAQPDAGVSIRVRGLASFNGSTEPLYVVDGVIINASSDSGTLMTQGLDNSSSDQDMNGLMGINPNDIASMEILKDASATAIYGAQGANGVVLITTKTATREKPTINFSAGFDVSQRYKKMDVLGFDDWIDFCVDMGGNISKVFIDPDGRSGLKVQPVDWQDYVMQTAFNQRYYVSISGRPKSLSYMFSLGYTNKEGVVKGSAVDNFTIRLNLEKTISKRLVIGTKTSLAYINSMMTQGTDGSRMNAASSLMRSMISSRPYMRLDDEEEEDDSEPDETEGTFRSGPDKWLAGFKNYRNEFRVTPNIYLQYTIFPWLNYKVMAGGDYRSYERTKWKAASINTTAEGNIGAVGNFETTRYNIDNTLNFNKKFGGHRVYGTLGLTATHNGSRNQAVEGWGITQYIPQAASLNSAPNSLFRYTESESSTLSTFIRAVYNYKDRYTLTATYRIDGSSRFQGANKWSSFPSFAFAWNMNREPWFKVPVISTAKIRLGWGRTGSQAVSNYQTLSNYTSTGYADNSVDNPAGRVVSMYPSNLANPNLKWETTEQLNGGLDLGLWKGRFTLNVDAYYKRTFDLLQSKNIPLSSGFSTIWINEGEIENKGLEFAMEAVPVKTRDFEWTVSGNISLNRNKILAIGADAETRNIFVTPDRQEEVSFFLGSKLGSSAPTYPGNIFMVGYPMGLFYGLTTDGIVQEGETGVPLGSGNSPREPGWIKFVDLDGNGYVDDDDRTIIGDPNPDFTYGFSTSLSYKRLTLTANFVGSFGNDIINVSNLLDKYPHYNTRNIFSEAYFDAWSTENPTGKYPALRHTILNDLYVPLDRTIEDASYLRLAKVALAYDIPMPKNGILRGLNVAASVGNPYVWTKYSGWDPDVNSFGANVKKMGVDVGSYPSVRTYSIDLKFRF